MTTLDKANWLYTQGYFDNMIYAMTDSEIEAIYGRFTHQCLTCGEEVI